MDVAAFKFGEIELNETGQNYSTKLNDGVLPLQEGFLHIGGVAEDSVLLLKDVLISNDVYIYGYPSSLGLKYSPQFDYTKPLLRKGIVANVYKLGGTIILDAPVYFGNSGGPVVQVTRDENDHRNRHHHVIGVASEFIPFYENWVNEKTGIKHTDVSNSGYSVAVAMEYVFELIGFSPADKKLPEGPDKDNEKAAG